MSESTTPSAPLEDILCNEKLAARPYRAPNFEGENVALKSLCDALATSPQTVMQTLVDAMLVLVSAASAGISLLVKADGSESFYWAAIAGQWKSYIGGGTPRNFGPCGDVLDLDQSLLMHRIEKRYPYYNSATPAVVEALLVPFYVNGVATGTLWTATHDDRKKFDAEDERVIRSLCKFTSSAYSVLLALDVLKGDEGDLIAKNEGLKLRVQDQADMIRFGTDENVKQAKEILRSTDTIAKQTNELRLSSDEMAQQTEDLRQLSLRLLTMQDNERRHIARELHDNVGQSLALMSLNIGMLSRSARQSAPQLVNELGDLEQMIHDLVKEIRTMSYLLHPPLLDEAGLVPALGWFTEGLQSRTNLSIVLETSEKFGRLPEETELALFRAAQECLTNVQRHSGSKVAYLRLARDDRTVTLEVKDDGCGLTANQLRHVKSQGAGVGIRGMRERLAKLGGRLTIVSRKGVGSTFTLSVPL